MSEVRLEPDSTACVACGAAVPLSRLDCAECGAEQPALGAENVQPHSTTMKYLLPVGRTGWSIAAGWVGFFSILVVPGPLALLLGIVALRDLKQRPEYWGRGRAWFGIVAGSIASIVLIVRLLYHPR